jgi:hypothetical protein
MGFILNDVRRRTSPKYDPKTKYQLIEIFESLQGMASCIFILQENVEDNLDALRLETGL